METLTVQITKGRNWYKYQVGKRYDVRKDVTRDAERFYLVDRPLVTINKNDCVVMAVNYKEATMNDGAIGGGRVPDGVVGG